MAIEKAEDPVGTEDSPSIQRNAMDGSHSPAGAALPSEGNIPLESDEDKKAKAADVSRPTEEYGKARGDRPAMRGEAQTNRPSRVPATPSAHAHGPDAGPVLPGEAKSSPKGDEDTKSSHIQCLEDPTESQEETQLAETNLNAIQATPPPSLVRGTALVAETVPGVVAHGRDSDILHASAPSSNNSSTSLVEALLDEIEAMPPPAVVTETVPGPVALGVDTDILHDSAPSSSNSSTSLVEALPVTEADPSARHDMMEAQPVDHQDLAQQKQNQQAQETREKHHQRLGIAFGVIAVCAVLALALSLAFGLKSPKEEDPIRMEQNTTPTVSPTTSVFLPPMENLETLYKNLPDKTRESLQNSSTPQYTAWEWLLNHPNVTNLEEWRKQQIFAMTTFYYSFHGPTWREGSQGDFWMNQTAHECDWALDKNGYLVAATNAGVKESRSPCDAHGKIGFLGLQQLQFPNRNFQPSMPPEIGLLTNLQVFGIAFGRLQLKLSGLLLPELVQLPKLNHLNLAGIGLSGTIPKRVGQMSSLLDLAIAYGDLTGTIPTEIAKLTKLRLFIPFENTLTGTIPSELGLMTGLIELISSRNLLSGAIPTQLGQLSTVRRFLLSRNELTGSIPSELGLLAKVTEIRLGNNDFSGSIPQEFWRFSSLAMLHLQNLPNLHGHVPNDIALPQLKSLDLSGLVHLSGTLPEHFWQFSHLESLLLPGLPNLHGRIPSSIFMPNLASVDLRGSTLLSGTLPKNICSILGDKFDCTGLLCGCGCPCAESNNQSASLLTGNQSIP